MEPKERDAFVNLRMEKIEGIRKRLLAKNSWDGDLWPCNLRCKNQDNLCILCGKTHDVTRDGDAANPVCSWIQLAESRAPLGIQDIKLELGLSDC